MPRCRVGSAYFLVTVKNLEASESESKASDGTSQEHNQQSHVLTRNPTRQWVSFLHRVVCGKPHSIHAKKRSAKELAQLRIARSREVSLKSLISTNLTLTQSLSQEGDYQTLPHFWKPLLHLKKKRKTGRWSFPSTHSNAGKDQIHRNTNNYTGYFIEKTHWAA